MSASVKASTSHETNGTSDSPVTISSTKSIYEQSNTQLHDLLRSHGVSEVTCRTLMGIYGCFKILNLCFQLI
jgi:hypothetical protein